MCTTSLSLRMVLIYPTLGLWWSSDGRLSSAWKGSFYCWFNKVHSGWWGKLHFRKQRCAKFLSAVRQAGFNRANFYIQSIKTQTLYSTTWSSYLVEAENTSPSSAILIKVYMVFETQMLATFVRCRQTMTTLLLSILKKTTGAPPIS
jgi:hypothetical protein